MMETSAPSSDLLGNVANAHQPEEEKICRICLQDDDAQFMMSPCLCKGSSKWVHRSCLDQWRIHEKDRAFSQCTECHFTYHMEAVGGEDDSDANWRRIKFYMLVSRDVLVVTLVLQLVILLLGFIVSVIDSDRAVVDFLNGENCQTASFFWCNHTWSAYYLCGLFALFVLLGIYGCLILGKNGCDCQRAFQEFQEEQSGTDDVEYGYHNNQEGYGMNTRGLPSNNQRRHYRYRQQPSSNDCCVDCCDTCCVGRYGGYYHRGPYYYCYTCPDCSSCDCPNHSSSNSDSDGMHVFLMILLVIAIVMAIVGFFVGLVLAVVVGQRIIQRHVFLLHKKRLVREFRVKDLQDAVIPTAPLDRASDTMASAPPAYLDSEASPVIAPSAPSSLHGRDVQHLKKLGLME